MLYSNLCLALHVHTVISGNVITTLLRISIGWCACCFVIDYCLVPCHSLLCDCSVAFLTTHCTFILPKIWVNSPHTASGYYTIYDSESLQADHFNTKLGFGDTQTLWARTGYLGFVRRTELTDASGGTVIVYGCLHLTVHGVRKLHIECSTIACL